MPNLFLVFSWFRKVCMQFAGLLTLSHSRCTSHLSRNKFSWCHSIHTGALTHLWQHFHTAAFTPRHSRQTCGFTSSFQPNWFASVFAIGSKPPPHPSAGWSSLQILASCSSPCCGRLEAEGCNLEVQLLSIWDSSSQSYQHRAAESTDTMSEQRRALKLALPADDCVYWCAYQCILGLRVVWQLFLPAWKISRLLLQANHQLITLPE